MEPPAADSTWLLPDLRHRDVPSWSSRAGERSVQSAWVTFGEYGWVSFGERRILSQVTANWEVAARGSPSCPQRQPSRCSALCREASPREPCDCWFRERLTLFTRGYPVLGIWYKTP